MNEPGCKAGFFRFTRLVEAMRARCAVIKITIVEGSFGSGDRPDCLQCDTPMVLFGRETHPDHGSTYELQSF